MGTSGTHTDKEKRKSSRNIETYKNGPNLGDIHNEQNEIEIIVPTKKSEKSNGKMIPFDIIDKLR